MTLDDKTISYNNILSIFSIAFFKKKKKERYEFVENTKT